MFFLEVLGAGDLIPSAEYGTSLKNYLTALTLTGMLITASIMIEKFIRQVVLSFPPTVSNSHSLNTTSPLEG